MSSEPPIRADLAHRADKRRRGRLGVVLALGGALLLAAVMVGVWLWTAVFADLPKAPDRAAILAWNRPVAMIFLDREGQELGRRGQGSGDVALSSLPDYLPRAFLAAEDRRFYSHPGVDPIGILRAARANLEARRIVQGGSTLTQQIARNLFLVPDRTFRRKLQEAALALMIERRMSKDDILALYLNRTYLGAGAYGVEDAAHTYFGKPAARLTLSEAALLAALPKAPSRLGPLDGQAQAVARSRLVLARMRAEGWITPAEEAAARAAPPRLSRPDDSGADAGYALDMAAVRARELAAGRAGVLVVRLTLDGALQTAAADAVRRSLEAGKARGANQAALVAIAPGGAVRALIGGSDYKTSGFNRAVYARRQPGSAFKPFVYAAALETGLNPDTLRSDAREDYGGWSPRNVGDVYTGQVSLEDALARSVNTVAARLANEVGAPGVASLARRMGIQGLPERTDLSIALGTYEVSLLDLTSAYQVFQQGGRRSEPYLVESIADPGGRVIYRRTGPEPFPVYAEPLTRQMIRMMRQVIDSPRGTGRAARLGRPAAAKTGTSQAYRDAWFVGFTPDLALGVWMGDDQGRPMDHVGGGDLPAVLWREVMAKAHEGLPTRNFPEGAGPIVQDEDVRRRFYADLARAFEAAADGLGAETR